MIWNICRSLRARRNRSFSLNLKALFSLIRFTVTAATRRKKYLPADEYLSGNVREKLEIAKRSAELYPNDYSVNVEALKAAQPKDLDASEIEVRLGATWIDKE